MGKLSVQDLPIKGKKVLVRVDFNVPLDSQFKITDDTRIVAALPTIEYILKEGGSVILMSHLGRPKGKTNPEYSLAPCAKRLSELLKKPVIMAPDAFGPEVQKMAKDLKPGEILMLENLRFYDAEEKPETDPGFVSELASLGDLYVNDAFGTAHRSHASTTLVAKFFPESAASGFLVQKEVEFLGEALLRPKRPLYAIIGGAKISSKLGVIRALLDKVDALFIGGGMTYTFLKAQGISIGSSIHEDDLLTVAKDILSEVSKRKIKFELPVDFVIADKISEDATTSIVSAHDGIPDGFEGLDIGPKTISKWTKDLASAQTIFWNGPVGVAEIDKFAKGTEAIAQTMANSKAITIIGGGDSVAAIQKLKLADKITHVSTGGGASLEYIEFGKLPGVEALSDKK